MFQKFINDKSGNIFTVLIGAVALVGVVSIASMNLLSGPVATSSKVMQKTMADSQMFANNKIVILSATNQTNNGDCEAIPDGYIEPEPWRDASGNGPDGVTGSQGGGFVPNNLGLTTTDPWGTEYGYCVWDVGTVDDASCGGATQLRLAGSPDPTAGNTDTQYVLALISAGPDRVFQTKCIDYVDTTTAILTPDGDDIVQAYTYNEASASAAGLWKLEPANATVASVDKAIKFADQTNASLVCDVNSVNAMRYNAITNTIQKCDGASGTWSDVSGGSGIWTDDTTHISYANAGVHILKAGETMTSTGLVSGGPVSGKFIWYPDKNALRIGSETGPSWDEANIGSYSTAIGKWVRASGYASVALGGGEVHAIGSSSIAMGGSYTRAYSVGSISIGDRNNARGGWSFAIGKNNDIQNTWDRSGLLGHYNTITNGGSLHGGRYAFGSGNIVSQEYSMALGYNTEASGTYSMALGVGSPSAGVKPVVSGNNSIGIFMGDQDSVNVSSASTMAILGGDFVVGSPQLADDGNAAHDARMFFDQSKAAFRAGKVTGTEWDDVNIGSYSVAMGWGTTASGSLSTAMGWGTTASGNISTALGQSSTASGAYSMALGNTAIASGDYSISLGRGTTSSGISSISIGRDAKAIGDDSLAIALGLQSGLKARVSGNNSVGIFMGDQGGVDITSANTMAIMGGDFVVGSPQLASDGNIAHDNRMWFDISKGAFRAGTVNATQWDDASVGIASVAMGAHTTASGNYSTALGEYTTASGADAVAIGFNTTASGAQSFAAGYRVNVIGNHSAAFSLGYVAGIHPRVSGNDSFAIFMGDQSGVDVTSSNTMAILGGQLVVGAATPTVGYKVDIIGDLRVRGTATTCAIGTGTGATNCTSDERLKEDIKPIDDALDKISKLNGVTFKWKDKDKDKNTHIGVIAQNIEKTFPEVVTEMPDGMKAVDYAALVSPLIEATKELKAKNEALENKVIKLTQDIEKLKTYTGYKKDKASFANIYNIMALFALIFALWLFRSRPKKV